MWICVGGTNEHEDVDYRHATAFKKNRVNTFFLRLTLESLCLSWIRGCRQTLLIDAIINIFCVDSILGPHWKNGRLWHRISFVEEKKIGPETLNSRKLRFVAPRMPVNLTKYITTDLIHYIFMGFAALPDVNPSGIIDWITFNGLQYPQEPELDKSTLFYCSSGQQTELFTVRVTFFHLKEINVDNEV